MNIKYYFIIILIVCGYSSANGQIKMVFRYDDYTLIPSQFNDSIIDIFQKNNIPLCLGIVPFDKANLFINKLNSEQINDLRSRIQRNEIEVTLHGFNHSNNIKDALLIRTTYSEFASLDFDEQYEKIAKGKKALDTLLHFNTNIFIPPFNTYDKNTLKALEDLDFEIISGSMFGVCLSNKIKYLPETYVDFFDLQKIINKYKDDDVTIILYFHHYSFNKGVSEYSNNFSKLISINQLDTLLQWVKKQKVSCYTFSDLARTENFDNALYQANSLKYNFFKKSLNKLKLYRYGVYSPMEFHKKNKGLLFFCNIILHLLSFLFIYFVCYYFFKILRPNPKIVVVVLAFFSIPLIIYLYHISNDYSFWMILIILLVSLIALILSFFRIYKLKKSFPK